MTRLDHWLMVLLVWGAVYHAIVAVHEMGHYLAGLVIGIPPREMKIVWWRFPQHVALRDGEEWVSPQETVRYVRVAERFMPTVPKALIFVAGGFLLETFALLLWVLLRLPCYRLAIGLAVMMTLLYLMADVVTFWRTRKASLDFSALYSISPLWGGTLAALMVTAQALIFTFR